MLMQRFTCLMAACTNDDAEVLKLLLKHGGDIHAQDNTQVRHCCPALSHAPVTCTCHMHLSHAQRCHMQVSLAHKLHTP